MKTPVIIAAQNEEAMIGRTLSKLDAMHLEPHVIANGCEDDTAATARYYGAIVYETHDAGKLPAIQSVLRSLGSRALDPLLYTDADSYPLFAKSWHKHMLRALDSDSPSAVSGPVVLDTFGVSGIAYDAKYYLDTLVSHRNGSTRFRGANMATHFQREGVLKRILDLPHIWPGEDRAMELAVHDEDGVSHQVISPAAAVMTSSRYVAPIIDIITEGRSDVRKKSLAHYRQRAADGSISLTKYLNKNKQL